MQEAQADAPRNLYAALALGALLLVLQPLSVAMALLAACRRRLPSASEVSLQPRTPLYRYTLTLSISYATKLCMKLNRSYKLLRYLISRIVQCTIG